MQLISQITMLCLHGLALSGLCDGSTLSLSSVPALVDSEVTLGSTRELYHNNNIIIFLIHPTY